VLDTILLTLCLSEVCGPRMNSVLNAFLLERLVAEKATLSTGFKDLRLRFYSPAPELNEIFDFTNSLLLLEILNSFATDVDGAFYLKNSVFVIEAVWNSTL